MTRTLYLHLGPAKTGTSALQHILRHHDNSVVFYPKIGLWPDGSHHNLVLNFLGDFKRPDMVREDAESLFARIGREARETDRDVVISSEILAGQKNLHRFVDALQRHMDGAPLRVQLLVCVREHFERAASLYNQRVKDAVISERRDPDLFLAEHAETLCYANLLRRLHRSGFASSVISYHPAEDCVTRILAHLGFAPHQIPAAPLRNVSLSTKALLTMLAANRSAPSPEQRARALRSLSGFFAPSKFIFGSEAAAEADRRFMADRQFLRRRFGIDLPVPDISGAANAFMIDEQEFDEIATATRDLGAPGTALRAALRAYVQVGK